MVFLMEYIKEKSIIYLSANAEINVRRNTMWTTPAATEMRFGFEVTMYVMNK